MLLDAVRDLGRIVLEVLEQYALAREETFQAAGIAQGQLAAADDPVEAPEHGANLVGVLANEGLIGCNGRHGVFLRAMVGSGANHLAPGERRFPSLLWLRICLRRTTLPAWSIMQSTSSLACTSMPQ
jgi:hypothetical protein